MERMEWIGRSGKRGSGLDCGGPPPLWNRVPSVAAPLLCVLRVSAFQGADGVFPKVFVKRRDTKDAEISQDSFPCFFSTSDGGQHLLRQL